MINNNFRGIELKASSFILKFGVTALLLLAATALTGCDISPEKHHDLQLHSQPFGGDRGAIL